MKSTFGCYAFLILFAAAAASVGHGADQAPQTKTIKAEVWDVRGPATFTVGSGSPRPIQAGTIIPPGSVVKTGVGAAVEISLGKSIGVIRLPQNTVLGIEKLRAAEESGGVFDIQLALPEGSLLGEVRDFPDAAQFDVKSPSALTGVRSGKFRIQSQGYVVVLSGKVLNVHVPASGEPALHKLNGPPPVYFSPTEGIRPAPPTLIQEVEGQLQAKLRGG
jgi:hypothetical protein